jgi:MFS family permease
VIMTDVSEEVLGRTLAMLQVMGASSGLAGALLGGVLGDWLGVRQAIWVLYICAVVAIAVFIPPAVLAARRLSTTTTTTESQAA